MYPLHSVGRIKNMDVTPIPICQQKEREMDSYLEVGPVPWAADPGDRRLSLQWIAEPVLTLLCSEPSSGYTVSPCAGAGTHPVPWRGCRGELHSTTGCHIQ
jgi:hypothetical protein